MLQLAPLIDNASPNHPLYLDMGEYEGATWIDKPLHIIGKGRGTALWNRQNPVLIITVPGVILENMLLDVTYLQNGVPIWYMPNCQPQVINCYPHPLEMRQMNGHESILQLGVLVAEQALELPLILDKHHPWQGFNPLPDGWQARPLEQNRHGHLGRGFMLNITLPKDEGYFYQIVNPKTSQGDAVLHVFGRIERKLTTRHTKPLCLNIQGKRLHFGDGLEVTHEHLYHMSQASLEAGVYGWFMKERIGKNDAVWVFWSPHNPPKSVRIDGNEIPRWARVVLRAGMNFQFGGVNGIIEEVDDVPVNVPAYVQVDVKQIRGTDFAVNLTTNAGFFQNLLGGKSWVGNVASLVDWLDVPKGALTINKDFSLPLHINDNVLLYHNGDLWARNVILLENQQDIYSFSLRVVLNVAQYALDIQPPIVPLQLSGRMLHQGEVDGAEGRVTLTNTGRDRITFNLNSTTPTVIIPPQATQVTLGSGEWGEIPIKLSADANQIPQGLYEKPDAIQITGALKAYIGVRADIKESNLPVLRFEDVFMFPEYNLAYPAPDTMTTHFWVANRGTIDGEYRIAITKGENAVVASQLTGMLVAGAKQKIMLTIPPEVLNTIQSPTRETLTLELWGNRPNMPEQPMPNQVLHLMVIFVVQYPKMLVEPSLLDLPDAIEGQPYNISKVINLVNQGNMSFMATITNHVAWLTLRSNPQVEVKAGGLEEIRLESNAKIKELAPGVYDIPNAITIEGTPDIPDQLMVGIRIQIIKAEPQPYMTAPIVNFGIIPYGTKLAKNTISIGNSGHATWQATITPNIPHVTAPDSVEIAAGMVADIEVSLATDTFEYGSYHWDDLITIGTKGDADETRIFHIDGYAVIEQPQAKLIFEPADIRFENVLQGIPPQTTPKVVTIQNVGTQVWQSNPELIQKPDWLEVYPLDFKLDMGMKKNIELRVIPIVKDFLPQVYQGAVVFSDGVNSIEMLVQIEVCEVIVTIEPHALELTTRSMPILRKPVNSTLTITNKSQAPFLLVIAELPGEGINLVIPRIFKFNPPNRQVVIGAGEDYPISIAPVNNEFDGRYKVIFTYPNGESQTIVVEVK